MESTLWIPSKERVWELAKIQNIGADDQITVETIEGKKVVTLKKSETHLLDESHLISLDDLCVMNNLHEGPLLDMLRRRLLEDKIYTYSADVLISVNPYKIIPKLYDDPLRYLTTPTDDDDDGADEESAGNFLSRSANSLPPHVYEIANNALQELILEKKLPDRAAGEGALSCLSQSIIISGESGAGKTEASKHAMRFLLKAQEATWALVRSTSGDSDGSYEQEHERSQSLSSHLQNVLVLSSVVFEAFGDAKTVRNDNSSRFGKYIKLQYTQDNLLISAVTETFLLEKSRLVSVAPAEGNYHVFAQMLCGMSASDKQRLFSQECTPSIDQFKILRGEGLDEKALKSEFHSLVAALTTLGCTSLELDSLWSLLAVVLHLGNTTASNDPTMGNPDETPCLVECSTVSMATMANLLGLPVEIFIACLRTQVGYTSIFLLTSFMFAYSDRLL